MNEVDYFSDLQWRKDFEEIEKAIKALNEGRSLDCWPLCSFGGKDADLFPWGCTGISKIVHLDDLTVSVEVGGHKTFCPEKEYEPTEEEQEFIFDINYPGYWSGDDWSIYMERQVVKVEWIMNEELGEPDYQAIAQKIVEEAKKITDIFENDMREASAEWEKLGGSNDTVDPS